MPASQAQASSSVAGDVELSSGSFEGLAHGGSGAAAVVELASGERVLTFTDLDTDNGPDLRVATPFPPRKPVQSG